MSASYDLGPDTLENLRPELDRLTADAVAKGRTYSLRVSPAGAGQFKALLQVHDLPELAEGGAA